MSNKHSGGIGAYLVYSAIFHIALIAAIIYLSLRYTPEIRSLGSQVVVSVVSKVPGPLASVRSILYPPKRKTEKQAENKPLPVKSPKLPPVPTAKTNSSMVYPKKSEEKKAVGGKYVPSLNPNAYANLESAVSLNNAYGRLQGAMVKGNIHRFQDYINKITPIIMGNFDISLNKYFNYKSVVAFQISKTGRIYGVRLVRSSGNGYFDSQSIAAVKLSSPLPPPPRRFMEFMNSNNAGEGALVNFNPKEMLKDR